MPHSYAAQSGLASSSRSAPAAVWPTSPLRSSYPRAPCSAGFDKTAWLDYQYEVGLRQHRRKKNRTGQRACHRPYSLPLDGAFLEPTVETMHAFLKPWVPAADLDPLVAAWRKAMLLQVVLYSRAYVPDDDW